MSQVAGRSRAVKERLKAKVLGSEGGDGVWPIGYNVAGRGGTNMDGRERRGRNGR
jgi:hypothetical protein